ncbi:MAG: outer membrane protein assembly factor BamD [Chitinophagales bacterium]
MIQKQFLHLVYLASFLLLLSSCDPYQKLLKSNDFELKYEKAKEYYNTGIYHKAIPLFEELMIRHKGTQKAEKLYYFYAYCHYGQDSYLMSAHYFKSFIDYYPTSKLAEDAQYMIGWCNYNMTPTSSLDQTYAEKAIESFQIFINAYPYSEKVAKCNELIDDVRDKLEEKAHDNAMLYYNVKSYKSSAASYQNILKDFPDTDRKEEVMFMTMKSYYLLAQKSIASKKKERYDLTVESYLDFIDQYPTSKYVREAERIYTTCLNNLKKY